MSMVTETKHKPVVELNFPIQEELGFRLYSFPQEVGEYIEECQKLYDQIPFVERSLTDTHAVRSVEINPISEYRDSVVFHAPHKDDETVWAGGTIQQHVNQGDKVVMAYWTDRSGKYKLNDGNSVITEDLSQVVRTVEVVRAAAMAGVARVDFIVDDNGLSVPEWLHNGLQTPGERRELMLSLRGFYGNHPDGSGDKAEIMYSPHWDSDFEAHWDHTMVGEVIHDAWLNGRSTSTFQTSYPGSFANWREYRVYGGWVSDRTVPSHLYKQYQTDGEIAYKKACMMSAHQSQNVRPYAAAALFMAAGRGAINSVGAIGDKANRAALTSQEAFMVLKNPQVDVIDEPQTIPEIPDHLSFLFSQK